MLNLFYDCYRVLNNVYSDGAYLKQALLNIDIEEKNRRATTKICYGVLDNDIYLSYVIKNFAEKTPKLAIRTVLKISLYCILFLKKQPYGVIDNAVELVKKLGKSGAGGFVNALLRRASSNDAVLPNDNINALSIKYSYPLFAVKMLYNEYGKETEEIIASKNEKTAIRFFEISGEDYLKNLGVNYQKLPFNNSFLADNFVRNTDYDLGLYTFQSVGSMAICDAISSGINLLDCCAAPGGKSVNLSYKFNSVTSMELHPHRAELIKAYAKRLNRNNIKVTCADATVLNNDYINKFDAVLCDVPCSGFGVVGENPDIKLNKSYENIVELKNIQQNILETCCKYVMLGGYLYYSTCSVFFDENIDNVKVFLKKHQEFVLCEADSKIPHKKIDGTIQFLPHISYGGGYYFAKLKRIG